MKPIELKNTITINGIEVNSFYAEAAVIKTLGMTNQNSLQVFILKEIVNRRIGVPFDDSGNDIKKPYQYHKGAQNFEFEMELKQQFFDVIIRVTIEGNRVKNRVIPGGLIHVTSAVIKPSGSING